MQEAAEQSLYKSPFGTNRKAEEEKPSIGKAVNQKRDALSGLIDEFSKNDSIANKIVNFFLNPLVLLGGLIATVYFMTRARKDGSSLESNVIALTLENKKLKKKLKKLQAQIELRSNADHPESDNALSGKSSVSLSSQRHAKAGTFYLD